MILSDGGPLTGTPGDPEKCAEFSETGCKFIFYCPIWLRIPENYDGEPNVRK